MKNCFINRWLSSSSRVAIGRHGDTTVRELAFFPSGSSFRGPQNFLKLNRFTVLIPTWENNRTLHKNVESRSDCMWGECERETAEEEKRWVKYRGLQVHFLAGTENINTVKVYFTYIF